MTELREKINNLVEDHQECLNLAKSIETLEHYTDTTATPEDIKEGKIAYSNGERIVGTMAANNYNSEIVTNIEAGSYQTSYRGIICNAYKIIKKIDEKVTLVSTSATYLFAGCSNLEEVKEIDTSNATDFTGIFSGCSKLKKSPVLNIGKATAMNSAFENCSSLEIAPELSNNTSAGASYLFSGCTQLKDASRLIGLKTNNMYGMFMNCINLENVSQFETSNVTNIQNAFSGCTSLSDESLNNILAICIPVTKLTSSSYYNLKHIGLTSDQATKCTTLSNYQAFLDAGWTTGY